MDLIEYSRAIAKEALAERFVIFLCFLLNKIDNISACYEKSGNIIYLKVTFSPNERVKPQEFFWLSIDIDRKSKEIEVIWDKLIPSNFFSLRSCGLVIRATFNYVVLRRGELIALLCYKKFIKNL